MRPLMSYYGGKQRIGGEIVKALPPHSVYVEAYCGGCAVLFRKGRSTGTNKDSYREVINDRDKRIIEVYRCVQAIKLRDELYERLKWTPYSRAEWEKAKDIIKKWDEFDTVDRAWAMVVKLQQSFGNILSGGWGTGVYGKNSAMNWGNWQKDLGMIFKRLEGVHIECDEALEVMKRWDSPQTCFYLDPPYVGTNQGYYGGFTEGNLRELVEFLSNCRSSFVLSGYPNDIVLKEWLYKEIEAHQSAGCKGQTGDHDRGRKATAEELGDRNRVECLWRIDRSRGVRAELIWLYGQIQETMFDFAG